MSRVIAERCPQGDGDLTFRAPPLAASRVRSLGLAFLIWTGACTAPTIAPSHAVPWVRDQLTIARALQRAEPRGHRGDWEFTLGGEGASDDDGNKGGFRIAGSLGHYVSNRFMVALRHNLAFADTGNDTSKGATRIALDYLPANGFVRPFLGANVGFVYGESVNETLAMAPELGIKFHLQDRTFLQVMGEFQFLFTKTEDVTEDVDTGLFIFSVSLGINF